ncbi:MAG: hypothetical protein KJ566_02345 [Nanoarchaeota archaeon]|nr:hypothetical protein [Nanoarchaeota archaeon]
MKHTWKITAILLGMFLITQLIGLAITNHYNSEENNLPYGMGIYEATEQSDYNSYFSQLVIAFIFAIFLLLIFTKFELKFVLRAWFFLVVIIALGIFFYSLTKDFDSLLWKEIPIIATLVAIPLAYFKIYKRSFVVHNVTELLVYPGIACVFVPILNIWTIIILLVLISVYDMWAVWKSGIMQKMAKYQIDKLKLFSGFFVPYISKTMRQKIKNLKQSKSKSKLKKIKVNVAILGGGDVVFPIITSGVVLKFWELGPALLVIAGAFLGLLSLFLFSEKKKFYPAMPFITAGIFLGMIIGWLIF